jgi:hypothetical protein
MDRPGAREPLVVVSAGVDSLEWTPTVDSEGATLTISDPQGHVRARRFASGHAILLPFLDVGGRPLADGTYTWELRLTPKHGGSAAKPLVESGYFTIAGGALVPFDLTEAAAGGAGHGKKAAVAADQIVPDDFIVDGKGCVGLGCVNNETFGPEALRLKQSVVRLRFEDTSTAAGFPNRDWQLTINDAGTSGTNRFSIEDLTAATLPFTVVGGAPTNSLYVDGVGNLGLGTATPGGVFDSQRASGSDILQRLWNTGAGGAKLRYVAATGATSQLQLTDLGEWLSAIAGNNSIGLQFRVRDPASPNSEAQLDASARITILRNGNVGIGTTSPSHPLQMASGAHVDAAGQWIPASSRTIKQDIRPLAATDALAAFAALEPVRYRVKVDPSEEYLGFIAEDVPELVATADRKGLSPMNVVAVLTRVLQEQEKRIAELEAALADLQRGR